MRKIFTVLTIGLLSFAASAQSVHPWISNNGDSVTLDARNDSNDDVHCSGSMYLEMSDNRSETIRVFEYISPRSSIYRRYRPFTANAMIRHVTHSIWCR